MVYGCDIVEVSSIVVNGFCNVIMTHPNDNNKEVRVHVSQIESV